MSYRNAVVTLSQRGWRRREPGLVTSVEQPSMLPRAVEMLGEVGISRDALLDQARVPASLFDVVVSRVPRLRHTASAAGEGTREVVSLLPLIGARGESAPS